MSHPKVRHPSELLTKEIKFENILVRKMAGVLGSVKFFYFCVVLDLAMLPPVIGTGSVTLWVTYIAQTVIQLLALPILQAYQNIQEAMASAKADVDHVAFTHVAEVSDRNESKLEAVVNQLDLTTEGGLKVISDKIDEVLNARKESRAVDKET